ncbi:MAG TPA: Fe-S cluster assembly protein SufD [Actinomycetota bacterium]|jgi:Fe-S cluster assembly protein SufD|nr:Fe-S cluster assembly protein SufD [Actinomycetota bacterium]
MPSSTTSPFDEQALERLPSPGFISSLRRQALEEHRGMPIPSQQTEEWRYTDLEGFEFDGYIPFAEGGGPEAVNRHGVLAAAGVVGERAGLQIQRNSQVISTKLAEGLAEQGVVLTDLDLAAERHADLVEKHLHQLVETNRSTFTALHAAFRSGGTFLYVPAGVTVGMPLQSLTWVDHDGLAVFPRTLLIAEEGSEVTFIDRYASPDLGRVFSDAVVEIFAGADAKVRYVNIQDWGAGVTHLAVQRMRVGRDAQIRSLGVAFGASLARTEVESLLVEDGGSSELLGVYFGDGQQHIDHRSIQDHLGSRTSSELLYKGAMRDRSNAIYTGTVIIREGAHRCDAYQTNRNILLSDHAKAHSVPNLEILTNDPTRCGHAASVGPVSEDEIFYLQSRGIPADEAQRLIVRGFFAEVLDRIDLPEVREGLARAIEDELAMGA